MQDANFTAPAPNCDIEAILSPDRGSDGIAGREGVEHANAEALASLAAR